MTFADHPTDLDDTDPGARRGSPGPSEQIDRRRWLALIAIALGVSVVIMDATIVNVALPVVAQAASDAMIHASRLTLAAAAVALLIGLAATSALPRQPASDDGDASEESARDDAGLGDRLPD